jgi:hypothetical protein
MSYYSDEEEDSIELSGMYGIDYDNYSSPLPHYASPASHNSNKKRRTSFDQFSSPEGTGNMMNTQEETAEEEELVLEESESPPYDTAETMPASGAANLLHNHSDLGNYLSPSQGTKGAPADNMTITHDTFADKVVQSPLVLAAAAPQSVEPLQYASAATVRPPSAYLPSSPVSVSHSATDEGVLPGEILNEINFLWEGGDPCLCDGKCCYNDPTCRSLLQFIESLKEKARGHDECVERYSVTLQSIQDLHNATEQGLNREVEELKKSCVDDKKILEALQETHRVKLQQRNARADHMHAMLKLLEEQEGQLRH